MRLPKRLGLRMKVGLSVVPVAVAGFAIGALVTPQAHASNNGLSIRPAMGWSSWSFVRRDPTAAKIMAQSDALKNSGLTAKGFVYVNLDDFWMKCDGNGPVDDYVSFTPLGEPRRLSGALQMGTFTVCRSGQDEVQVVLAATGRVRTVRTRTRCPG